MVRLGLRRRNLLRHQRSVRKTGQAFGDRVVYTRYVAPIPPKDAWVDYFKDWPQFLVPPDDPMYDLTDETAALAEAIRWWTAPHSANGGSS